MRPLTISAEDRMAPTRMSPAKIKRKPVTKSTRAKPATGKRTRSTRRKPQPTWFKPAVRAAAIFVMLASLAAAGGWFWRSGFAEAAVDRAGQTINRAIAGLGLTVREVTVVGRRNTKVSEILKALGAGRGDIIFSVDLDTARERLEALGWVRRAMVERRFPDTVHVSLEERQPFALWQYKGAVHLVDRNGALITSNGLARYRELVNVVGEDAGKNAEELFETLRSEPALMKRVKSASFIRGRRWDVTFANGVKVRLPEDGVTAAWRKLASLEREYAILGRDLIAVDMRIADRLVVRLAPDAAAVRRRPGKST